MNENDIASKKFIFPVLVFDESFIFYTYVSTFRKRQVIHEIHDLINKLNKFDNFSLEINNFNIKDELIKKFISLQEDFIEFIDSGELLKEIMNSSYENEKLKKMLNNYNKI